MKSIGRMTPDEFKAWRDDMLAKDRARSKARRMDFKKRHRWFRTKLANHIQNCVECKESPGPCKRANHLGMLLIGQNKNFESTARLLGGHHAELMHTQLIPAKKKLETVL